MSRNASASQRPRPRIACWRHGPGSPAASARIHPVLRGSFPSNPSRNFHADAVTRSWRNKEPSRAFTSRNDDAQSSSVVSTDAPAIHDPPNHGGPWIQKSKENATVMLVRALTYLTQWPFETSARSFRFARGTQKPCRPLPRGDLVVPREAQREPKTLAPPAFYGRSESREGPGGPITMVD